MRYAPRPSFWDVLAPLGYIRYAITITGSPAASAGKRNTSKGKNRKSPLVKTACKLRGIMVKQRGGEGAEISAPEQNQRRGKEYRPRHAKSACPQVRMRLHRGAGDGGGKGPAAGGGPSGIHEGRPASCATIDITGHQGRAFRLCEIGRASCRERV